VTLEHQSVYSRRLSADLRRIASSLLLQILQYLSSSLLALLAARHKYSVRKLIGALAVIMAMSGCGKEQPPDTAKPTAPITPSGTTATTGAVAPRAAAPAAVCEVKVDELNAAVAAGGSCTTDTGCTCFNGGVSPKYGCGGVTDKATATKIEAIAREFAAGSCKSGINCAAWSCQPICTAGKCVNGPR
jgi:hypothetical protein